MVCSRMSWAVENYSGYHSTGVLKIPRGAGLYRVVRMNLEVHILLMEWSNFAI